MEEKKKPIFLKLKNNLSYYKIIDSKTFQEIQIMGSKKIIYNHSFKNYFDALQIQDLLNNENVDFITEQEYNSIL